MRKSDFLNEEVADDTTQSVIRMLVVESEQKYKTLVENALAGIFIIDQNNILYGNPYMTDLIGYTLEEALSMSILDLIEPSHRDATIRRMAARRQGESRPMDFEVGLIRKDGNTVDISVRTVPCMYKGSPAILGTAIDVTEKHSAEVKLRQLAETVKNIPAPVLSIDTAGEIFYTNRDATRLLGYSEQEMTGMPLAEIVKDKNPGKSVANMLMVTRNDGRWAGELPVSGKDGISIATRVSTIPLMDRGEVFTGATIFLTP
jgi:PAS domain S-box-containing protein